MHEITSRGVGKAPTGEHRRRDRKPRRRNRRVGWDVGRVALSQPTRASGEHRELPIGVRSTAPAASTYFTATERFW